MLSVKLPAVMGRRDETNNHIRFGTASPTQTFAGSPLNKNRYQTGIVSNSKLGI